MGALLRLVTITLDPRDARAVAVFQDGLGRTLPLWVDDDAAAALAAAVRGERWSSSSAAGLVHAAVEACGGAIDRVELVRVQGGVLRAVVVIAGAAGMVELPTRASLGAAIAIVAGAPIVADEVVLEQVNLRVVEAAARATAAADVAVDEPTVQSTADRWNALLEHLADKLHDDDRAS